jgi:hypothetical protein
MDPGLPSWEWPGPASGWHEHFGLPSFSSQMPKSGRSIRNPYMREAASYSQGSANWFITTFFPMSPLPPMTTIFMAALSLRGLGPNH